MTIGTNITGSIKGLIHLPGLHSSKKASKKTGLSPGSLVHVGEQKMENTVVRLIDYNQDGVQELEIETIDQCRRFKDSQTVTWIEVFGLHSISVVEQLGILFEIHPLVLEDILNTAQRPKVEEYDDHLYLTLKNPIYNDKTSVIDLEQISIVTGPGYVISFHEKESNLFEPVRNRIRNSKLRIRKRQGDYLAYALFDTVVDQYFAILETLGEELEELDSLLLEKMGQEHLQTISDLKKSFIRLRKAAWPLQEIITNILKDEYGLIEEATLIYFRDVHDHIRQIIDSLETYREAAAVAMDSYLSVQSMKMNEIMKVLTVFAAIFMPLTFVAGIYGMNFEFMPELNWRWGYFTVLGAMAALMILFIGYFRRKKWL